MQPIEVEKIQRLAIEPGETLVVTLPQSTMPKDIERIAHTLSEKMPEGVKVLIVSGTIELSVIGGESA